MTLFYLWRRDLVANMIGHGLSDFLGLVLPRFFSLTLLFQIIINARQRCAHAIAETNLDGDVAHHGAAT